MRNTATINENHVLCVSNLVITSPDYPGKVRVVVRTSNTEVDPRHPATVSSVTTEVDPIFARQLRLLLPVQEGSNIRIGGRRRIRNQTGSFGNACSEVTMAGQLAHVALSKLWDAKGDQNFVLPVEGFCEIKYAQRVVVGDPKGTNISEDTLMITTVVDVTKGADRIPRSCRAYSDSAWVAYDAYRSAVRARDGQMIFPDGDPWEMCMFGACNQGTDYVVSNYLSADKTLTPLHR